MGHSRRFRRRYNARPVDNRNALASARRPQTSRSSLYRHKTDAGFGGGVGGEGQFRRKPIRIIIVPTVVLFIKNVVSASHPRSSFTAYHRSIHHLRLETVFVCIVRSSLYCYTRNSTEEAIAVVVHYNLYVQYTRYEYTGQRYATFSRKADTGKRGNEFTTLYTHTKNYMCVCVCIHVHFVVWFSCIYTNNLVPVQLLQVCAYIYMFILCATRENAVGPTKSPAKRHSISNATKT